jgi:hypothetical protein
MRSIFIHCNLPSFHLSLRFSFPSFSILLFFSFLLRKVQCLLFDPLKCCYQGFYCRDIDGVHSFFQCFTLHLSAHFGGILIHKSAVLPIKGESEEEQSLEVNFCRFYHQNSKLFIIDKSNIWSCLFLLSARFFNFPSSFSFCPSLKKKC